jgi:hypothetical protein
VKFICPGFAGSESPGVSEVYLLIVSVALGIMDIGFRADDGYHLVGYLNFPDLRKKPMNESISFQQRLQGRFEGILRWQQLDELWPKLKQSEADWYFYQVGSPLPETALSGAALAESIDGLDALLRQEHDYDYCGIVYADDLKQPTLVKVYDPSNLGSSCSHPGAPPIPPRWIISQYPPQEIVDEAPMPNNRKRWWNQLFRLR